jgi:hypothetical protein
MTQQLYQVGACTDCGDWATLTMDSTCKDCVFEYYAQKCADEMSVVKVYTESKETNK